mmetsp:Transcript_112591/g.313199  ORF Transcript_112591/g.313199 Transcript_112591/m.313199 type:complete len:241 (+) Transcript_112591:73-795(+)
MAPPNKAREEAWARAFVAEAEAGHSGLTLQLVTAVRRGPTNGTLAAELGLGPLRVQLGQESSAAGRNRLLRRWLAGHREAVVASWTALGFPAPLPAAESAPAPAPQLAPLPAGGSAWSCTEGSSGGGACVGANSGNPAAGFVGVAVFDFDQTITIRHVGVFEDLAQVCERSLGGAARVGVLNSMLAQLRGLHVAIALVSRNSRHVVRRAMERAGLLAYVTEGLIFGFEDYEDEVFPARSS